jgi:Ion channel
LAAISKGSGKAFRAGASGAKRAGASLWKVARRATVLPQRSLSILSAATSARKVGASRDVASPTAPSEKIVLDGDDFSEKAPASSADSSQKPEKEACAPTSPVSKSSGISPRDEEKSAAAEVSVERVSADAPSVVLPAEERIPPAQMASPTSLQDQPSELPAKQDGEKFRVTDAVDPQVEDDAVDSDEEADSEAEIGEMERELHRQRADLEAGWKAYKKKVAQSERNEFIAKLVVSGGLFIFFWVVGSMVFMFTEQLDFFSTFYFTFVFFSTIGYGEFVH